MGVEQSSPCESSKSEDDIFDLEQFDRLVACVREPSSPEEQESAIEWLWDAWCGAVKARALADRYRAAYHDLLQDVIPTDRA